MTEGRLVEPTPHLADPPLMPRLSVFSRKPPLSTLTVAQLLGLAAEFRAMALTASTPEARHSLNVLAIRYARLAARRELEEGPVTRH